MLQNEALDLTWAEQPHTIRAFLEVQLLYKKLAEEVDYLLKKHVAKEEIEYSSITHRVKTVESFCEKSFRKHYKDPLNEVTDLSGVRIIYLYEQDRVKIENIIQSNFKIIDKIDKIDIKDTSIFGYGALHYLVKLDNTLKGPRYDDLAELVCEIQVRTILQDAWAVVAHHLSYKKESDIPKSLVRKINALSGLFEVADDQFNRIRTERCNYRENIEKSIDSDSESIMGQEINQDNLIAYSAWKMPSRKALSEDSAAEILREIEGTRFRKIGDIDKAIDKTKDIVEEYEKEKPPTDEITGFKTTYAQAGALRIALALLDDKYMNNRMISESNRQRLLEYRSKLS